MYLRIPPKILCGTIRAVGAKSILHRAAICAALAPGISTIHFRGLPEDLAVTIRALIALGANVQCFDHLDQCSLIIEGIDTPAKEATIALGESGSSLRFLLPVAAALGVRASFDGVGRLPERPLLPLLDALRAGGADFSADRLPLTVTAPWPGGDLLLPADLSSQFVSGALLAAPVTPKGLSLRLTTPTVSASYIGLTLQVMASFGVNVRLTEHGFEVPAEACYRPYMNYLTAGDWSNAAFLLAAGALAGPVTVSGLDPDDLQGDRVMLDILRHYGARIDMDEARGITVTAAKRRPLHVDLSDCPDLLPVLSVLAAAAEGESRFTGIGRLRHKESDRPATTAAMLRALDVDVHLQDDAMSIRGGKPLRGDIVDAAGDHRIAMSAAIAISCLAESPVLLTGSEAVDKSYPDFYGDLRKLGGL